MKNISQPKPLHVFVYNDLPFVAHSYQNAKVTKLITLLYKMIQKNKNTTFVEVDQQIAKLAQRKKQKPFETTLAIGDSGERVAHMLHQQTLMFPTILTIPLSRKEKAPGKYSLNNQEFVHLLTSFKGKRIAIIEDTIYSGLTLRNVLNILKPKNKRLVTIFTLQGIESSIKKLRKQAIVAVGRSIKGRIEKDVTIIKASGLFTKGAIRLSSGKDLAFFERKAWMNAWFPENALEIITLSSEINDVLSRKNKPTSYHYSLTSIFSNLFSIKTSIGETL